MPLCRKPAVTKRHHWPCISTAGTLLPASEIPDCGLRYSAIYKAVLINRMIMVVKRACGIRPPKISPGLRRSAARGPSGAWQYGHALSLVVTNARQFGHIRLLSTAPLYSAVFSGPHTIATIETPDGQDGATVSPGHPRRRQADLSKRVGRGQRWQHQCAPGRPPPSVSTY